MKPNVIQLLFNIAFSASYLFIPNLAKDLGASDTQLGIIGAVYGLALFSSSYIFGRASDVYGRKFFLHLGLGVSTITFFLQVLTDPTFVAPFLADPWLLALTRGLAGFSIGIFPAALTAYVYEAGDALGRFSSFGALGWAVGNFAAGLIAMYWGAFMLSSACLLLAFLVSFTIPTVSSPQLRVPFFPKSVIKKNWHLYLSYFMRHTGANCIWIIYPLYIVSLGGNMFWVGVIYTVNTASQFLVMRFVDGFRSGTLVNAGLILSSVTFFAFTLAQNFYQLIPIQVLLACSWSCLYVGALLYLMQHNIERATCTGLLSSVINLAVVFGALIGGAISQLFGFRATMYAAAALTAVGFCFFRAGIGRVSLSSETVSVHEENKSDS
ncbi:MAG: Major Facilitator Superfamily protein [Candidatus Bathyarchaeota archaeon BA2]|nr:MAG: Major Facilitator Superfamily protein [Candidatus Bathyarchaeota archaeon BA2]